VVQTETQPVLQNETASVTNETQPVLQNETQPVLQMKHSQCYK